MYMTYASDVILYSQYKYYYHYAAYFPQCHMSHLRKGHATIHFTPHVECH